MSGNPQLNITQKKIVWLDHKRYADSYRSEMLHCIASQKISDSIHSRTIECRYRDQSLRFSRAFRHIIDTYYCQFSRDMFDWINVLGVVPMVPVLLASGNIVPKALDFDVCQVGIYHDPISSCNCYVVRYSTEYFAMLQSRGMTPMFDERYTGMSVSGSVMHSDTREVVAQRLDFATNTVVGMGDIDYGVFVMDGFNRSREPTLSGMICSIVARLQPEFDRLNMHRLLQLKQTERITSFKPYNQMDGVADTREMTNFYNNMAIHNGASNSSVMEYLKKEFIEATSEKHRADVAIEARTNYWNSGNEQDPLLRGTGGVAAADLVTATSSENALYQVAQRALLSQMGGYQAIVGGKLSTYTPPMVDFSFIENEQRRLEASVSNMYGIPHGFLDSSSSLQAGVELEQITFRNTVNTGNQMLEKGLNAVFSVFELGHNSNSFMSVKFQELVRPEAIRKICQLKKRSQVWSYFENNKPDMVQQILADLKRLKQQHGNVPLKLVPPESGSGTPQWNPVDDSITLESAEKQFVWDYEDSSDDDDYSNSYGYVYMEGHNKTTKRGMPMPANMDDELESYDADHRTHTAEPKHQDAQSTSDNSSVGYLLGSIPYLTNDEIGDVYLFMVSQLKNSEIADVYDRCLDEESSQWMKRQVTKVTEDSIEDARNIRLVYHIYGNCTLAEMISIYSLGFISAKELMSQVRYKMNLENEPEDDSIDTSVIENLMHHVQVATVVGAMKTTGVPTVPDALMAGQQALANSLAQKLTEAIAMKAQGKKEAQKKLGTTDKKAKDGSSSSKKTKKDKEDVEVGKDGTDKDRKDAESKSAAKKRARAVSENMESDRPSKKPRKSDDTSSVKEKRKNTATQKKAT